MMPPQKYSIKYKLSIAFKDGRYRCEITDFEHNTIDMPIGSSPSNFLHLGLLTDVCPPPAKKVKIAQKMTTEGYSEAIDRVATHSADIIFNLGEAMKKPTVSQSEDW